MEESPENRTGRECPRTQVLDRHVGARMRQQRIILGLDQDQLAEMIGVTYQQTHKYEKGMNRISAGRLYTIAQALGVDVGFFFEDLSDHQNIVSTSRGRLLLEFVRNVASITDRSRQTALSKLVQAVADTTAHDNNALNTKPDPDLSAS